MSQLEVALLSSLKLPTLSAFISHSGCGLNEYTDLDDLLIDAASKPFNILFCEEKLLLDENTEDRLLRFSQRNTNIKVFILNEKLEYFKLDTSGSFNPEDLSSIKKILKLEVQIGNLNPLVDDSVIDEIVIEVDEKTEEDILETAFLLEVEKIKKCMSLDEIGKSLLNSISVLAPEKNALIFKYLPNYCSLVLLGGVGFSQVNKLNGTGLNFASSKDFNPKLHLSRISEVPAFQKIAKKVFKGSDYEVLKIEVDFIPRLLLSLEGRESDKIFSKIKALVLFAEERAKLINIQTKYHSTKNYDELTGLLLRDAFFDKMQDEYIRAKRIFLPVTAIIFEIDHFEKIKDLYNKQRLETLLKMLSKVLKDNVRHNDFIGLISESRFGLLLPHMNFSDGQNKVSSLRKVIQQTKFFNDMKKNLLISVSSSLLTYPRFSKTADEGLIALESSLDRNTFTDAIIELSPREGFRPDFEEIKLPSSTNSF